MLRIKELLKVKGITVQSLSDQVGITYANMNNIVNEKTSPSLQRLQEIAAALNVELWELFTESASKGDLYGFVEYTNTVYKIDSVEALESLLKKVKAE